MTLRHRPGRQPRRDRLPHHPHRPRTGPAHRRRLLRRRPRRPHVRLADEAVRLGPGARRRSLPRRRRDPAGRRGHRRRARSTPATASSPRTPAFAAPLEAAGHRVRRPDPRAAASCSAPSTPRAAAAEAAGRAAAARHRPARRRSTRRWPRPRRIGYPGDAQGHRRRRRHRHAGLPRRRPNCADGLRAGAARRPRRSFGSAGVFLERSSSAPATSRCRSSATAPGRVVTSATATARCSAATRRCVEEAPAPGAARRTCATQLRRGRPRLCARRSTTAPPGPSSSSTTPRREEASFLEVNTRLQVEHPVTEEVYGVDLVEWMLRLARGRRRDVVDGDAGARPRGHAVEARVYAEDPARDYRPSAGPADRGRVPRRGVRVDAWVETGTEVTTVYDPMLAKVIAYGTDRDAGPRPAGRGARRHPDRRHRDQPRPAAGGARPTPASARATHSTGDARRRRPTPTRASRCVAGGTLTTVQDWPGRTG